LIERLADAGYKKLSMMLRGSDQARALKEAVTAAVRATVGEIGPSDEAEAEQNLVT
jgi:2-methylcitrate dehydratase PrpD